MEIKNFSLIIAILVVAGILVLLFIQFYPYSPERQAAQQSDTAPAGPASGQSEAADTSTAIQEDLESIDIGDLDAEFETIDADLNTL